MKRYPKQNDDDDTIRLLKCISQYAKYSMNLFLKLILRLLIKNSEVQLFSEG